MYKVGIFKYAKDEGGKEIEGSRKLLALADFDTPKYRDWFCRTFKCCCEIDQNDLNVFGNVREARAVEPSEYKSFKPGDELVWYLLNRGMDKFTVSAEPDETFALFEIMRFVDHVQDCEVVRPREDEHDVALARYERWYH